MLSDLVRCGEVVRPDLQYHSDSNGLYELKPNVPYFQKIEYSPHFAADRLIFLGRTLSSEIYDNYITSSSVSCLKQVRFSDQILRSMKLLRLELLRAV